MFFHLISKAATNVFIVTLLLMSCLASAAEVSGMVTDDAGQPIGDARSFLLDTVHAAVTRPNGQFTISDAPPGEYTLVVGRDGFATALIPLVINDIDQTKNIDITLQPNTTWLQTARYTSAVRENKNALSHKSEYLSRIDEVNGPVPNIVVILFDDLGYGDLSSYGNRLIETPHIDKLAKRGIRLTNFYSSSPLCTPSRFSLMTGRVPARGYAAAGVFWPEGTSGAQLKAAFGQPNNLLRDEITISEVLQVHGYSTALVGKWHLGSSAGHLPRDFGFDYFFGVLHASTMRPFAVFQNETEVISDGEVDKQVLTDLYTEQAENFIESNQDVPFFLMLSHSFPHVPHYANPKYSGTSRAGLYGEIVENLDRSTGIIVDALRRTGMLDNTLIIITSDNGGDYLGSVGDLRGRKGDTLEGGVRVPGIVHWPNGFQGNRVVNSMAIQTDLLPTLLGILDIGLPADRLIDGKNLVEMLRGESGSPHRYLYYFNAWNGGIEAIRDRRFKFRRSTQRRIPNFLYPVPFPLQSFRTPVMLTDLDLDREAHDISKSQPEAASRLSQALEQFETDLQNNQRGWVR